MAANGAHFSTREVEPSAIILRFDQSSNKGSQPAVMRGQQHPVDLRNSPLGVDLTTHQLIWSSIEKRHHIQFLYDGKKRIAEPHDYGIQNGCIRLLVYQFAGESNSGRLPAWRLTDVDGITELKTLGTSFPGNRPAPSGQHHRWDQVFIRVGEPGT